jgi:hypothetical protein
MHRLLGAVLAMLVLAPAASAATPPVFRTEVPAGGGTTRFLGNNPEPARSVDGSAADWQGTLPGFGGALDYSRGELVYEDHIFDAYGPDNGQDAQRLSVLDPATAAVPELYRLDPAYQYAPGEFGIPTGPLVTATNYGDDQRVDQADLSEVRLGTDDARDLELLARTTTMDDGAPGTALLVLLDTTPGTTSRAVPFNSGLTTTTGDVAVFLTGDHGAWVDLADPADVHQLPAGSVATNPTGYDNTVEARLPAALLGGATHSVGVAVGAGLANADGSGLKTLDLQPNIANVAFRTHEPARNWWDKQQALELQKGTMDAFFTTADLDRMAAGADERYEPGPGYHDRVFTSTPDISKEQGTDGLLQHYGVYLPSSYRAHHATPTQFWFHFRGGDAHIAAAVVPGVIWDMGERQNSIVITPDGRGESGWYVGKSQEDVLQVWADSHKLLPIDRNRTYIAGHSMGGWASYLLPVEHPDWFAAAFPASGPPTQGAVTGADFPGCDQYTYDDYAPCFIQANGGDARAEYTAPLVDNLKWVPYAIYQGTNDELVPTTGVTIQAKRFQDLGYRYRYYLFPGQEHYGPPVVDQWMDGANYEHQFVRDPNPPEVTYIRSMVFEHAIETVNSGGVEHSFPLDHAYWMSGLTAVDAAKGTARFDGRSLALADPPHTTTPEAGGPATADQNSPYAMAGQAWNTDLGATPATSNAFTATLTGARAVTLHMRRMKLDGREPLTGHVKTDSPLALSLTGRWARHVAATIDGRPADVQRDGHVLTIAVPTGEHDLAFAPAG